MGNRRVAMSDHQPDDRRQQRFQWPARVAVTTVVLLALTAWVGAGTAHASGARTATGPHTRHNSLSASASTNPNASVAAAPAQIDALTVTPDTVLAGAEVVIKIHYSGGSAQDQFGTVITDLNDDLNPFTCSEVRVSGTTARGTEQEACSVPSDAYVGNYSAQGVIFNPGPPPSVVFSGPDTSFAVAAVPTVAIETPSLPNGVVWSRANHSKYSAPLIASGGDPPYEWSLAAGSDPLPPGLKLRSSAGVIEGRATKAGTYSFTVQVVDTRTQAKPHTRATVVRSFTIVIAG